MQRPGVIRERLAGLCVLGALLFSPALVHLFDRGASNLVFGVPILIVYLFGVWAGLILLAGIVIWRRSRQHVEPLDMTEED